MTLLLVAWTLGHRDPWPLYALAALWDLHACLGMWQWGRR